MKEGFIQMNPWWIVYNALEDGKVKKKMLYLDAKHFYSSGFLNSILARAEMCKVNTKKDLKWVSEIIRW